LNAAVFDAVMIGVAKRLVKGAISEPATLKLRYSELLKNGDFLAVAERATADEESVSRRLRLATKSFADVP
jgi:deoxyinosine 3'endonuclease (endonuclease V)